jgi:hypothetical protein
VNHLASQDAATLAAEELASGPAALGSAAASAGKPLVPQLPSEPTARFTTIEEEEIRLRSQNQRSWLLVAAQLGGLVAVLASLTGVALYLSRPQSADKLYASIDARVEGDDDASLGKVENEVNEFLRRFPEDPRADVLRSYQERIELDKLERRLQRLTRGGGINTSLLPAEQLYLQAVGRFASFPDESLAMLEALVDLYGAEKSAGATADLADGAKKGPELDAANRTADVVQLAKRRLKPMQADIARQREQQVTALEERLAAAERLSAKNPQQAAAMYRAILKLHENNEWAEKVVETARSRLAKLETK